MSDLPSTRTDQWSQPGRSLLAFLIAVAVAASAAVTVGSAALGDYRQDAKPSIDALSQGNLQEALTHPALMGSVSILLRAPLVALARVGHAGELGGYRAGAMACLLFAALTGVGLALSRRSSLPPAMLAVIVVLTVVNPASTAAILLGHPEEALGAALCVAAVALALRDRVILAAIALGLALATKQWAILAVAPVILATPGGSRVRLTAIAGGIAAVLTIPLLLADPAGFSQTSRMAATAAGTMTPTTWWFFLATPDRMQFDHLAGYATELTVYRTPSWLGQVAHPLIVGAVVIGGALVHWSKRSRDAALPLLALLFLLRCTLDPVDNAYYHLPLLLSLLAWETLATRRTLPYVTMLAAAALWLTYSVIDQGAARPTVGLVYACWTGLLALHLIRSIWLCRPAIEGATAAGGYGEAPWRRLRSQTWTT